MPGSGDLRNRVTFQKRGVVDDGYGNTVSGDWADQFTVWASIRPAPGREEVLAQRLQGVRPVEIVIRASAQAATIQPDWRAINTHAPTEIYNIRDIRDPSGRKIWKYLTCTLGVAT